MGKGKMCINCWVGNLEERKRLKFIGGSIILTLILKAEVGKHILNTLARDRELWWFVFSMIMKLKLP